MKVIYKKSIIDKINDAKRIAYSDNKMIDYIEVTEDEAVELYDSVNTCGILGSLIRSAKITTIHNSNCFGELIKVKGYK